MTGTTRKGGKLARYRALKLKENAHSLSEEDGISYEKALEIVSKKEKQSEQARKQLTKGKSKSAQKRLARRAKTERDRQLKKFGNKLTAGAPPLQGGSPGLGKKS